MFAPLAMPILPPAVFQRIYGSLGGASNAAIASGAGNLPQNLGDRFGWDSLTQTVQRIYAALPPEERAQACVVAANYGEAGALSLLAAGSVPPIVCGHNNYYLSGPGATAAVGSSSWSAIRKALRKTTRPPPSLTSSLAATEDCPYWSSYERNRRIYVLYGVKDPSFDLRKSWPSLKHFDRIRVVLRVPVQGIRALECLEQIEAAFGARFAEYVRDVILDCMRRDMELSADLLVRCAIQEKRKNLRLSQGQPGLGPHRAL